MRCDWAVVTRAGRLQPFLDWPALVQPDRSAVRSRRDEVERDAQLRVNGRGDVLGRVFVVRRPAAFLVGATQDRAAGNAGPGHDREAGGRPVVASARRVDLWRPTEVG